MQKEIKVKNKKRKKEIRLERWTHKVKTPQEIPLEIHRGDSFEINKIYCGDCLRIMKAIPDEFVDLIITSPPYNFGLDDYEGYDDTRNWEEYFQHLCEVFAECYRVLKHSGRICVNVQPLFSDYVPIHHIVSQQLRDLGLLFKAEIIWEKHNYNCKYTAWGSWKSPSMPYLKYTWEFIEVFCKGDYKKVGRAEDIDITGEEFKEWVYAKWDIAPESRMKELGHPAVFPEEIPYRLIKLFSYIGDAVLDPFNGVGTTTLVAARLKRNYIGIDISEKYCQKARERLQAYQLSLL
ncbi:MAG: site-specific DNA-methyltransferase [Chloroflexota bacterium]|nr:site-specific DNA-methyltransferase [Chloroflexota bacterium]